MGSPQTEFVFSSSMIGGSCFHRSPQCLRKSSIDDLKGLRPLPPTPADSRIFGFFDFSKNVDFWNFPVGFGVWEGLPSIGIFCGLQMDGLSAHFDHCGSIFVDFHYFDHLAVVSSGLLTLLSDGPRTLRDCPESPGSPSEGPGAL